MGVGVGRKPGASCWVSLGFAAVERKGLLRTADVADRRVQEADTRPCLDFFFLPRCGFFTCSRRIFANADMHLLNFNFTHL
jgi:hypothetical protein